jgi:transposase
MHAAHKKLVARGAAIAAQIKALTAELDNIKARLPLDAGRYTIPGAELLITTSVRTSLDSKLVKGFLTPAQLVEATKSSPVTSWKFSSLPLPDQSVAA